MVARLLTLQHIYIYISLSLSLSLSLLVSVCLCLSLSVLVLSPSSYAWKDRVERPPRYPNVNLNHAPPAPRAPIIQRLRTGLEFTDSQGRQHRMRYMFLAPLHIASLAVVPVMFYRYGK